jgi:CHAD domain-containing protein
MTNSREIKAKIRLLRKIKRDTRPKSEERHDLNRQIRELRKKLEPICDLTNNKKDLIAQILKLRPQYKNYLDLTIYSEKQLKFHLDKIRDL